jgi:hypothetical protein
MMSEMVIGQSRFESAERSVMPLVDVDSRRVVTGHPVVQNVAIAAVSAVMVILVLFIAAVAFSLAWGIWRFAS